MRVYLTGAVRDAQAGGEGQQGVEAEAGEKAAGTSAQVLRARLQACHGEAGEQGGPFFTYLKEEWNQSARGLASGSCNAMKL